MWTIFIRCAVVPHQIVGGVVTSTGGAADAYAAGEFHGWPYQDILIPLQATAQRLGMSWAEPLVIHGAREVTDTDLAALADRYRALLNPLASAPITAR